MNEPEDARDDEHGEDEARSRRRPGDSHRGDPHEDTPPGSGREFSRGQASDAVDGPDTEHDSPPGSGRQFSRGQASDAVDGPDTEHESPPGSGRQFARGQASDAVVDPEGKHPPPPGSGRQFDRNYPGEDRPEDAPPRDDGGDARNDD